MLQVVLTTAAGHLPVKFCVAAEIFDLRIKINHCSYFWLLYTFEIVRLPTQLPDYGRRQCQQWGRLIRFWTSFGSICWRERTSILFLTMLFSLLQGGSLNQMLVITYSCPPVFRLSHFSYLVSIRELKYSFLPSFSLQFLQNSMYRLLVRMSWYCLYL